MGRYFWLSYIFRLMGYQPRHCVYIHGWIWAPETDETLWMWRFWWCALRRHKKGTYRRADYKMSGECIWNRTDNHAL